MNAIEGILIPILILKRGPSRHHPLVCGLLESGTTAVTIFVFRGHTSDHAWTRGWSSGGYPDGIRLRMCRGRDVLHFTLNVPAFIKLTSCCIEEDCLLRK